MLPLRISRLTWPARLLPTSRYETLEHNLGFPPNKISSLPIIQLAEVRIVESIPKSASGKILKRVLKEQLKAELAKK